MATYSDSPPTMLNKEKEIETLLNQWVQAMAHGSVEDVLELYSHDAVLHPTISPTISDTIEKRRDYFTLFKNQGKIKASIEETNIRVYEDMAISSGRYTFNFTKDGKTTHVPARFSFTYLKTARGWKIVEHHSSSLPQPIKT
jgi:uncharacterized protein (TIGR02246 family)